MKLWRYIQGYRKGKDAHKLEKEAMSDPFLAHALRGFDRVQGDHIKQIEHLQQEVRRKSKRRIRYIRAASIAASILLLIGIGTYFIVDENKVPDSILSDIVTEELQMEENIPAVPPPVIAQQRKIDPPKAPKPATPEIKVEEQTTLDALMAPAENNMQHVIIEEPVAVSADSVIGDEEEMGEPVELNEVVVTGYKTVKKQSLTSAVATVSPQAQARKVKGKVTDAQGEPLVGVSIQVDGTNDGAITDIDGEFEITAPDGSKIRASYIGYEGLEKQIQADSVINFAMNEDSQTLDEVVVTGMGSESKSRLKEPEPVDGMRKYKKYLKQNLIPPTDSECKEVKGEVVLQFNVNQQGRPEGIIILESLCPSADLEAIRLVAVGPDWTPGDMPVMLEIKF